jgi:acylphosphatase
VIRRRVIVSGQVQGVFFRDTCQRLARDAGVSGWVRNRADGTVEAVFEGPADRVERLIAWCHRGPRDAVVERVDVIEESPQRLSGFAVH